jgi:hypothetical protein
MAKRILGSLNTPGPKGSATFLHELPKLFHFGYALNGYSDDFRVGFHLQSFLGSVKRPFINKKRFARQFRSCRHMNLQYNAARQAYTLKTIGIPVKGAVISDFIALRRPTIQNPKFEYRNPKQSEKLESELPIANSETGSFRIL